MPTETHAAGHSAPRRSHSAYENLYKLSIGGGFAFWGATFLTSLTPIAADYRASLSISYVPMLVQSLVAGLAIGCGVGYPLLRFFDKVPTRSPILKSELLSSVVLAITTIMTGATQSLLGTSDALRHFLMGAVLNAPRFLILGLAIGYLYTRLYGSVSPAAAAGIALYSDSPPSRH